MRQWCWLWCLTLLLVAACGGAGEAEDGAAAAEDETEAEQVKQEEKAYEVFLGNVLSDTLRGDARFGFVYDPDAGHNIFVVELQSGYDFAGGFFIARGGDDMPVVGTFPLVPRSDSLKGVSMGQYTILYRQGMLRDLTSASGSVRFTLVSDTLIEGTFDATLRGFLASGRQQLTNAEVASRGRFKAKPGAPGYIMGL